MELVYGQDLADRLTTGPLPVDAEGYGDFIRDLETAAFLKEP
jgi:hypothetical protein